MELLESYTGERKKSHYEITQEFKENQMYFS